MPDRISKIVASFTDALNKHGVDSFEVRSFYTKYADDKSLISFFELVIHVKNKLKEGMVVDPVCPHCGK